MKIWKNLLKKNADNNIYAPVNGRCLDITECRDGVFAAKLLGDGFLIETEENVVTAPCDGVITMIFPTGHAFGIRKEDGEEVLIHIGLETVNLDGAHFQQLACVGKKISRGTPVIRYENGILRQMGYDTSVLVVVTGREDVGKGHLGEAVTIEDVIIEEGISEK